MLVVMCSIRLIWQSRLIVACLHLIAMGANVESH